MKKLLGDRLSCQGLAHYHAQTWNDAELPQAFGVDHKTVRRYLDLLTSALVVRQRPPWHENLGKRQVKSPKVYIADTGLLHTLLGIKSRTGLESHPKVGASWEGFMIEQLLSQFERRSVRHSLDLALPGRERGVGLSPAA